MPKHAKLTGALLGLAGGAAGVLAMQAMRSATQRALAVDAGAGRPEAVSFAKTRHRRGEDATITVGRILFTKLWRREPGGREKEVLGHAVHWGYGLAMAAGYGMLRGPSRRPVADLAGGALFGIGLWGVSDELMVPLFGLGDRPGAVPARVHGQALAGHLAYGAATAAAIQGLARAIDLVQARRRRGRHVWPRRRSADLRERLAAAIPRAGDPRRGRFPSLSRSSIPSPARAGS